MSKGSGREKKEMSHTGHGDRRENLILDRHALEYKLTEAGEGGSNQRPSMENLCFDVGPWSLTDL